jgi:hypothetical protein
MLSVIMLNKVTWTLNLNEIFWYYMVRNQNEIEKSIHF